MISIQFSFAVLSSINILGCNSSVQCVLEVQNGDHIECSLKGVRPEVNLEFVYPDSSTPSPITLEGQPRIPENHGDVYDISIKSRVKINADAAIRNITIVCRVTNSAIGEHLMEAKAILTLGNYPISKKKLFLNGIITTRHNFHGTNLSP